MRNVISKTFGGLSFAYYFRQLLFSLLFPAMIVFSISANDHIENVLPISTIALFTVNTFLYPYSRFMYEQVVAYIVGYNQFWLKTWLFLVVKLISMLLCWAFALFIAPAGLAYLYYLNRETSSDASFN
jgi:hypothetical protein